MGLGLGVFGLSGLREIKALRGYGTQKPVRHMRGLKIQGSALHPKPQTLHA